MLEYKGYLGTIEAEDGIIGGRVSGLKDVIAFEGATFADLERAFRDSIDDYLDSALRAARNRTSPTAARSALRSYKTISE